MREQNHSFWLTRGCGMFRDISDQFIQLKVNVRFDVKTTLHGPQPVILAAGNKNTSATGEHVAMRVCSLIKGHAGANGPAHNPLKGEPKICWLSCPF
ncbi:hypothetical protein VNO77_02992 [Canavalia gladiata]|uniref:Uncharacterized protein n=1 Tax=Canavalia gladiata TaxID=3824 RepID=A0AAN9MW09_CANGL